MVPSGSGAIDPEDTGEHASVVKGLTPGGVLGRKEMNDGQPLLVSEQWERGGHGLHRRIAKDAGGTGATEGVALFGECLVTPAEVRPDQSMALSYRVVRTRQEQSANFRERQREQIVDGPPFLPSSPVAVWRVTAR